MPSYDDLFRICVRYTAANYYVAEVIPEKKVSNARKRYPVPITERVVALIDTTAFGSAKTGLVIGETGLYWRNFNLETKQTCISWNDLASVPIAAKGIITQRVEMGDGATIELGGSAFEKDDVVQLLSEIQHLIRSPATSSKPLSAVSDRRSWLLAVSGQQFGPCDLPTIRDMVLGRQFNPEECLTWREGMPDWVPFKQVPPLAALLHDLPVHPRSSPPPLPSSTPPASADLWTWEGTPQGGAHPFESRQRADERSSERVDLNHASADQLLALPGMTLSNSQKVVKERDRRGGFRTVEEAGHYLKLRPHVVERLKEQGSATPYRSQRPSTGRLIDF